MRIRALQHVSIRSRDLDRARDFYERLLGLPTVPRPELGFPGAWYGIGASQLHLIAHEKLMDGIDPTDPHFALEVESLEAVRRELEAQGGAAAATKGWESSGDQRAGGGWGKATDQRAAAGWAKAGDQHAGGGWAKASDQKTGGGWAKASDQRPGSSSR